MDPIADKVFIAATFLPAVDLGWVPSWLVALLFVREFFVTAARTSYERRDLQLKSSYLARYKTWVQMCGVGVLMLLSASTPDVHGLVPRRARACCRSSATSALRCSSRAVAGRAPAGSPSRSRRCCCIHRSFGGARRWRSRSCTSSSPSPGPAGLGYLFGVGKLKGRGRVDRRRDGAPGDRRSRCPSSPSGAQSRHRLAVVGDHRAGRPSSWRTAASTTCSRTIAPRTARVRWGARLVAECGLLARRVAGARRRRCRAASPSPRSASARSGCVVAFVQKRRYYLEDKPRAVAALQRRSRRSCSVISRHQIAH